MLAALAMCGTAIKAFQQNFHRRCNGAVMPLLIPPAIAKPCAPQVEAVN